MTQDAAEPPVQARPEEMDDSIRAAFGRLVADGRAYVGAEAEKQKLRAGIVGGAVRDAAILGVVAFLLAFAIIVALLVGSILALAPFWGIGLAMAAVLGTSLLVVLILLLLARARIARMTRALKT